MSEPSRNRVLKDADYERLLAFRDGLRRFLHWSEEAAKAVGVTASQHQILLAVRGRPTPPSIGDLAEHLVLRHNSVVELIDRAEAAGLLERRGDATDQRVVRLALTELGATKLAELTAVHLEELSRLRSQFTVLWEHLPEPTDR